MAEVRMEEVRIEEVRMEEVRMKEVILEEIRIKHLGAAVAHKISRIKMCWVKVEHKSVSAWL